MHAPVETVAKRVPPSAGVLELVDECSCILHAGSRSLEGMIIHLLLLGVDFHVHEPPELIDYIRRLANRLGQAVG